MKTIEERLARIESELFGDRKNLKYILNDRNWYTSSWGIMTVDEMDDEHVKNILALLRSRHPYHDAGIRDALNEW